MLETRVKHFIQSECHLNQERVIVVGVSGGPDSLCLLGVLYRLGYPVVVAHFNHQLRDESLSEQRFVVGVAKKMQVLVFTGEGNVAAFGRENGLSLEEAARTMRYHFLFSQAHQLSAQAVVVGHTADDQVETILMHILRGAGLSGLKGMLPRTILPTWSPDIPLVRPLLTVWREEILEYCNTRGLQPIFDRSNLDLTFFRNRLRHELIPLLEIYSPRFRTLISRMANVLAADEVILQGVVDAAWTGCVLRKGDGFLEASKGAFLAQPRGVRRRILRRAIAHLRPGLRDVDFETIERASAFLERASKDGQCDLAGGLTLFLEQDRFWVAANEGDLPTGEWPQMPGDAVFQLGMPGEVRLSGGWRLTAEQSPRPLGSNPELRRNADPYQAWLDADSLSFPLQIRTRASGDRFQALGMQGHSIKLSDFMINVRMPRRARSRWPLACSEGAIVWLPGYRLGDPCRVTKDTRNVIHLRLFRE